MMRMSFGFTCYLVLALVATSAFAACGGTSSTGTASRAEGSGGGGDPGSKPGAGGAVIMTDSGGGPGSTPGDFASCAKGSASASRLPVYLSFVLDGSGSMNHDNKWVAVTGAIDAIFTDMQKKADPGVGVGLLVYSDSSDPNRDTDGKYPSKVDVPIAFVDQAQLGKLIKRTAPPVAPESNTPTGTALSGAYEALANLTPSAPLLAGGKRVVVLMTDGIPTDKGCKNTKKDGTDDYASYECIKDAASQLKQGGPSGPIETFVIGVGPLPGDYETYDPYFLGTLAMAGGTAPPGCNPKSNSAGAKDLCYFNIDPTGATAEQTEQAFTTVLDDIRGQVASCTLAVDGGGDNGLDLNLVNVQLSEVTVAQDPQNGWTYTVPNDARSVTLHGSACDRLLNDPTAKVSIVIGCATVVP